MSEGGEGVKIENSVEGPQQKIEVHLSRKDFESKGINWAYEQISQHLPQGELKDAFDLAMKEREARRERGIDVLSPTSLVEGSNKYAFRGVIRKSNGEPMHSYKDAILSDVSDKLFIHGIEAPGSEENILPRNLWDPWVFPTPVGIEDRGEDVSEILVYRNETFVIPPGDGDQTVTRVNMETGKKDQISKKEAVDESYPTLRDILVGQIEVYFDKAKDKFLDSMLVDGRYPPTASELDSLISKIDLQKEFAGARLESSKLNGIALSFKTLEQSHLFALKIMSEGVRKQIFLNSPSEDFYKENLLTDFRIDGPGHLNFMETSPDPDSIVSRLSIRNSGNIDSDYQKKLKDLVKSTIIETMPHLAQSMEKINLV